MRIILTILVTLAATAATARTPADIPEVRQGLFDAGMAYELAEKCNEVGERRVAGLAFLNSLYQTARGEGFSRDEVQAWWDSPARKALEGEARAALAAKGVVAGNAASYCQVARAEIAAGSQIGRLLKAR
ncbi:MAG: DUF5333 domain-containing protein [Shimia sp.]